ncbi:MAG: adaptor protein MecA [Peptococcaceae bacterium]|nr:adaptor protein MecA [Peptococcaceae bacterium]
MKLNLVNDNQLQIIVTRNDMFGRDMRALFKDIIEQAKKQFGFEVMHNTSLMVEAFPLSEESMIMTITKVNSEDINFEMFAPDLPALEPWAVFEFKALDDVIELAKLVCEAAHCDSVLYKYRDRYGLYVQDVNSIAEEARGHFVEYGEISQMSKAFLDEHGQVLIREQALSVLGQL